MSIDTSANQSSAQPDVPDARLTTLIRLGLFFLIMAAIWFAASGRLDAIMAWLYLAFYALTALVATLATPLDQEMIEERTQIKEGTKSWDKPIVIIGSLLTPLGFVVLAGLDQRFGWSPPVSLALQIAGLIVVVSGNLLGAWAAASNKFYARFVRIQKERGHTVISGGPYRLIRHPGYAGQILFYFASAFALNSLWTLVLSGFMAVLLIVRTALEDRTLRAELPGYVEYARRTRYRLVPGVW